MVASAPHRSRRLSGYALCSWYKDMCRAAGRAIGYVVAITADPDDQTCREFGIDRCLAKPLSTACIVEMLREYWGASQSAAAGWSPGSRAPDPAQQQPALPPPPTSANARASAPAPLPAHLQHLAPGGGGGPPRSSFDATASPVAPLPPHMTQYMLHSRGTGETRPP